MISFQANLIRARQREGGGGKGWVGCGGLQAAVETRFIKFSSKLMRQFDVGGYYYSETVRCDGAAFTGVVGGGLGVGWGGGVGG